MKTDLTKLGTLINTFLLMVGVIGGMYAGYKWIQDKGKKDQDIEQRIFETPKQKFEVVEHTEDFDKTQKQIYEQENHIDSIVNAFKNNMSKLDTIIKNINERDRKNAITNYQSKRNTDSLIRLWKGYNDETEKNN